MASRPDKTLVSLEAARRRHPVLTTFSSLPLRHIAGHVIGARYQPDAVVSGAMGLATAQRTPILIPNDLLDAIIQRVTDNNTGAGKEFDRAHIVAERLQDTMIPALGPTHEHPREVTLFLMLGQQKLLEAFKVHSDDPDIRLMLADMYGWLQQNPAVAEAWSQEFFEHAEFMVRPDAPDATFVNMPNLAIDRMGHDVYGSDGQHPLRLLNGRSPFASQFAGFVTDPRVTGMSSKSRGKLYDLSYAAAQRGLENPMGDNMTADINETVLPSLKALAPAQFTVQNLRDTAVSQAVMTRAGADGTSRKLFNSSIGESVKMWKGWTSVLENTKMGAGTSAGEAIKEVEHQINEGVTQIADLEAPIQAAFIQEGLSAIRAIITNTQSTDAASTAAVSFYDKMHEVLPDGWAYLRRDVQLANSNSMNRTLKTYAELLDNPTYGLDGRFPIRQFLQNELTALAEMVDDISSQFSHDFFVAIQQLKPVIQAQEDVDAIAFGIGIYSGLTKELTHASQGMVDIICVEPVEANLKSASQLAMAGYEQEHSGMADYNPEHKKYAAYQAKQALLRAPTRETVKPMVDSLTDKIFGFGTEGQAVAEADLSVLTGFETALMKRGNNLSAQVRFTDALEAQLLDQLAGSKNPKIREILQDVTSVKVMGDVGARVLQELDDRRVSESFYLWDLASRMTDRRIALDTPVSAVDYLNGQLGRLTTRVGARDAKTQSQFYTSAQILKAAIHGTKEPIMRDVVISAYTKVVNALTGAHITMVDNILNTAPLDENALQAAADKAMEAYHKKAGKSASEEEAQYEGFKARLALMRSFADGIVNPIVASFTDEIYGLGTTHNTVANAEVALLARINAEVMRRKNALEHQTRFVDTIEARLLDELAKSQNKEILGVLNTIIPATPAQGRDIYAYLDDMRMVNGYFFREHASRMTDPRIASSSTVSAASYLNGQIGRLTARMKARDAGTQYSAGMSSSQILTEMARTKNATYQGELAEVFTKIQGALPLFAEQRVTLGTLTFHRENTRLFDEAMNAIKAKSFLSEDERGEAILQAKEDTGNKAGAAAWGSLWTDYYKARSSAIYGQGKAGDITKALKDQIDLVTALMGGRNSDESLAYLRQAWTGALQARLKSGDQDERQQLFYIALELLSTSTIAEALEKREEKGFAKMTRTLGRETNAFIAMLIANPNLNEIATIETRYFGPGKDTKSLPFYVMTLGLIRWTLLQRGEKGESITGVPLTAAQLEKFGLMSLASIEQSLNTMANGNPSAFMELFLYFLMVSPWSTSNFAPLSIHMKGERKGTVAVRKAVDLAQKELTERMAKKDPPVKPTALDLFYVALNAGADAPEFPQARVPFGGAVNNMLELAVKYPALKRSIPEHVWRFWFDHARMITKPPGVAHVLELSEDPAVQAQQIKITTRLYEIVEAMVKDERFNYGSAPVGWSGTTKQEETALLRRDILAKRAIKADAELSEKETEALVGWSDKTELTEADTLVLAGYDERLKLVNKTAAALVYMGRTLGMRDHEAEYVKKPLRARFMSLLADIQFDAMQTQFEKGDREVAVVSKFAPELHLAAQEILSRCMYEYPPEVIKAFFEDIASRAGHDPGMSGIVENNNWQELVVLLATIPQGMRNYTFSSQEDLAAGFRTNVGPAAADVSLELLKNWAALAGPYDRGSILGTLLEKDELNAISNGQGDLGRQATMTNIEEALPPQVIRVVSHYGTKPDPKKIKQVEDAEEMPQDQRTILIEKIEELGTEDLMERALQTTELRPPRDIEKYLKAAQLIGQATRHTVGNLLHDYLQAIATVNGEIGLNVKVDAEGRLIEIPDMPTLTSVLTATSEDRLRKIRDAVGLSNIDDSANTISNDLAKHTDQHDGTALLNSIIKAVQEAGPDINNTLKELIAVLSKSESPITITGGVDGQAPLVEAGGSMGGAMAIAALIANAAASRQATAQATADMFGAIISNRQGQEIFAKAVADETGETGTAEKIGEIRIAVLERILKSVTNAEAGATLVQSMEQRLLTQKIDRLEAIAGLENTFETDVHIMATDAQADHLRRVKEELRSLREIAEAKFTAGQQLITQLKDRVPVLAEQYAAAVLEPNEVIVKYLDEYRRWLKEISSSGGVLARIADAADAKLGNLHLPANIPLPTEAEILAMAQRDGGQKVLEYLKQLAGTNENAEDSHQQAPELPEAQPKSNTNVVEGEVKE